MSEPLARTPEPELMDDAAQALAYAKADFSAEDAAFMTRLTATFPLAGRVVDLGCGPGNIALRIAAASDCEVVGVDGAEAMLAFARERGAPYGARVRFVRAFIPADTLPDADLIVSNSLLHHLHDPHGLWRTVRQIGRPRAPVFVGDLLRPATDAAARALVDRYAADEPAVLRADFLASLRAAFTVPELRAQLDDAGLDFEIEVADDRHVFIWGRLPG